MSSNDSTGLFDAALSLGEQQRAELAHRLLLSLESHDQPPAGETVWIEEIQRRMAAVQKGEYTAVEWREAIADIRRSLSQGNSE